jgi:hypothetical protein
MLAACRLVSLLHTSHIRVTEHPKPVPSSASRRGDGASAPHKHRSTDSVGRQCDVDVTTVEIDFTRQQSTQQIEFLVDDATALADVDTEVLELLWPISKREDVGRTALADDVEDRHVLSKPNWIVETEV